MGGFRVSPALPQPKTMRQTNYLGPRDCYEKKRSFFQKYENRFIFHILRDLKIRIFMILVLFLTHFNRDFYRKWSRNRYVTDFPRKSRDRTAVFRMPGTIPTIRTRFPIDLIDFRESKNFRTASLAPLDASARADILHLVKIPTTGAHSKADQSHSHFKNMYGPYR